VPVDLAPILAPQQSALLVFECQQGVIGAGGAIPGLVAAVRESGMLETLADLLDAARSAGVRVFYCTVEKRADGVGHPFNTPLEMRLRATDPGQGGGPRMGPVVAELAPQRGDVVVSREHGMTGFYESGLDATLRNCGVRSVVITGVSLNVGVMGTAFEAVNRGYRVVVPSDCVAADPPEYKEPALRYSIRNVAFLSTAAEIARIWETK
jgi:nicotinamidase-related amidase